LFDFFEVRAGFFAAFSRFASGSEAVTFGADFGAGDSALFWVNLIAIKAAFRARALPEQESTDAMPN
jgi:hypothetical protein